MNNEELMRANGDIKNLFKIAVDVMSYEDKTNPMLREIVEKSDNLDDASRELVVQVCDCCDKMIDCVMKIVPIIQKYVSPMGIPTDDVYKMSYSDFNIMYCSLINYYREFRGYYDEAYDKFMTVAKLGYYHAQPYTSIVI